MENVLLIITGFSWHGLQHSPAVGQAGPELIDHGNRFITLNLDVFRFNRLLLEGGSNRSSRRSELRDPVYEKGIY